MIKAIWRRLLNILIALDQFLFVLITLGHAMPDETMSAGAYRLEHEGHWAGKFFRPVIDFIFWHLFRDRDHCFFAAVAERDRLQSKPYDFLDKAP